MESSDCLRNSITRPETIGILELSSLIPLVETLSTHTVSPILDHFLRSVTATFVGLLLARVVSVVVELISD